MYNHYIVIDSDKNILEYFTDNYKNINRGEIIHIRECPEIKFYLEIDGKKIYNPDLIKYPPLTFLYKYDNGEVIKNEL